LKKVNNINKEKYGYPTVNSYPSSCMQSSNNFEHLQCLLESDRAIWEGRVMQQLPLQFRQACIIKINAMQAVI